MTKLTFRQCKSKGCSNPVLNGKYCEQCTQKRKEVKDGILGGAGGAVILGLGVAIKKGILKQGPKIVSKVIQGILKKS